MRTLSTLTLALLLILVAGQSTADPITFDKIADNDTSVPGSTGTFIGFDAPSLDAGDVAFRGISGAATPVGIYTNIGGALNVVADSNTPVPGGTGNFSTVRDPSIDDGNVAFSAVYGGNTQSGVYTDIGGSLNLVANTDTPIPGGTGNFSSVTEPSFDNGNVAFRGTQGAQTFTGIYTDIGGSLNLVADTNTPIPGGTGNFESLQDASFDSGNVAFRGIQGAGIFSGIYTDIGGSLNLVADTNTPIPGGTGNFQNFGAPSLDAGIVAFRNASCCGPPPGIYISIGGALQTVADANTAIPGGTGNFTSLGDPSLDNGNVAFVGGLFSDKAIFVDYEGVLLRVLGVSDGLFDGKTLSDLTLSREALSGNQLAFRAQFSDMSSGIYIATIPEPSTALMMGLGVALLAGPRRRRNSN